MGLTGKQQVFVIEYVKCLNATEAARIAGYEGNDVTLASVGYENLRKPHIASEINRIMSEYAMSAAEVLMHLTDIARGDVDDVLDEKGNVDIKAARAKRKTRLIKKFSQRSITLTDKDGEGKDIYDTEVEMYDRMAALGLLAKYHDLTNRLKIVDWRDEIVALLKGGQVTPEQVREELGNDLAEELFIRSGVPVASARKGGQA